MKGYYIGVKNDLIEPKHYGKMGVAVWEFMWCLDKMTSISEEGIGTVLGGRPILLKEIADDLGKTTRSVSTNLNALQDTGYINLGRTARGNQITVNKASKVFGRKSDRNKASDPIGTNVHADRNKASTPTNITKQDNNTMTLPDKPAEREMTPVMQVFEIFYRTINPNINFGNRTSRSAAEFMIKKDGLEKTLNAARYAVEVFADQYAPTITTPYQLKEKMTALIKHKLNNSKKGINIA